MIVLSAIHPKRPTGSCTGITQETAARAAPILKGQELSAAAAEKID